MSQVLMTTCTNCKNDKKWQPFLFLPQVEDHGAERSAARVLGDGQDGQGIAHERQDRHGGEDGAPNHSLQRREMILQEIRVTVTVM